MILDPKYQTKLRNMRDTDDREVNKLRADSQGPQEHGHRWRQERLRGKPPAKAKGALVPSVGSRTSFHLDSAGKKTRKGEFRESKQKNGRAT